jgi:hypothetical protein
MEALSSCVRVFHDLTRRSLNEIEDHKVIIIYSINGKKLLMKAGYVKGLEVKLPQSIDFPVFTVKLSEKRGDAP